jgi:hypothetical protein
MEYKNMNSLRYLIIIALLLSFPLASQANFDRNGIVYGHEASKTLFIEGNLSEETVWQVEYETRGWVPEKVVISSGGGVTLAGIELAKIIRKWNATLEVDGFCFSACANYLFAGARTKIVRPFSVVGVHGYSSRPPNPKGRTPRTRFEHPIEPELSFLAAIGIKGLLNDAWAEFYVRAEASANDCLPLFAGGLFPPQSDWEADGVVGILKFWYPKNEEEFLLLSKRFRWSKSAFAFLSMQELSRYCFKNN